MRVPVLAFALFVACDAGAKPDPAKGSAVPAVLATTDCKAVIAVLHEARYRNWYREEPPPQLSDSIRSLGPACAKWPESYKACVVARAGGGLSTCSKLLHSEAIDSMVLSGFDGALEPPVVDCTAAVDASMKLERRAWERESFPESEYTGLLAALRPIYLTSCEHDIWPERYKACLVQSALQPHPIECERMLLGTELERTLSARVHEAEAAYNASHGGAM